jgi:predicted CopG family antitoxin
MKTIQISYDVWKELKRRALDGDTTIGKVIEGLLNGN